LNCIYRNATVDVRILDSNDEPPQIENSSYTFYIDENENVDAFIGHINVTDKDSIPQMSLTCINGPGGLQSETQTTTLKIND